MCIRKLTYVYFFLLVSTFSIIGGCAKEYSYEGGLIQDSASGGDTGVIQDSIKPGSATIPNCVGCINPDTATVIKWSFKVSGSSLCGSITNAVLSPDRNAMTFFGPSACSRDSGLIITAFFNNQALNRDQINIKCEGAALEYYDNTTGLNLLQSGTSDILTLTINSYVKQTGLATGAFNGYVLDKKGNVTKVDDGKFTVIFK